MRRIASPALVALAALGLGGCASMVVEDWHAQPLHPALPPHHVVIAEHELPRVCGSYPGMHVHGCAVRVATENVCFIYTAPRPAEWLMAHERKHCAGWDHGPVAGRTATVAASELAERTFQ
jgi:hypothetical protein